MRNVLLCNQNQGLEKYYLHYIARKALFYGVNDTGPTDLNLYTYVRQCVMF